MDLGLYRFMGICFICWLIIPYYFISLFIAGIISAVAIGRSFSWLFCFFNAVPSLWSFFSEQNWPLASGDICSRFLLYINCPVLQSGFPPRIPDSFYWRMILDTKIRVVVLIATGGWFLLDPLSWQSKKIYVCMITQVHTHTHTYISLCNHLDLNLSSYWCFQI